MVKPGNVPWEKILLLAWVAVNLGVGGLNVHDYGMSVDEPNNHQYAEDTLAAYPSFFGVLYKPEYSSSYDGHGPAFVTATAILIRIVQGIFPHVFEPDLWHYSYFITFQLTGLCLYWLTKRWFNIWTGWSILILFTTQPLLWGHAFINPKDVPFMFFFTLSIVFGFRLVDGLGTEETFFSLETLIRTWTNRVRETDPRRRKRFLIHLALALSTAVTLVIFSHPINSLLEQMVIFFYNASPDTWAGRMFSFLATHIYTLPAQDSMIRKVLRGFRRTELEILIASMLFFGAYFGLLLSNTNLPTFLRDKWEHIRKPGETAARLNSLRIWFTGFFRALFNPQNLLAGIVLGLATAVRAIAPLAGVIVLLHMFIKIRSRAWTGAIAYFLIAGAVTYIAWPHLWGAPVQRYLGSLGIASNFPWLGRVLFNGQLYRTDELPGSYLPVLLNIQLTEPFLFLFYVGLGFLGWRLLRNGLKTDLLLFIGFGSIFPLFGLAWLRLPFYDNFRQLLFLLPGLFLVAGFALEAIFNTLRQPGLRLALILVMCLPGLKALYDLHPYQYVYYNSLVGGMARAAGRFEMDYWGISMREMALDLNKAAEPGSTVVAVVVGSTSIIDIYTRPDLTIEQYRNTTLHLNGDYDYAILSSRWNLLGSYPKAEIVSQVERDGAVLAMLKRVKGEKFR